MNEEKTIAKINKLIKEIRSWDLNYIDIYDDLGLNALDDIACNTVGLMSKVDELNKIATKAYYYVIKHPQRDDE